MKMLGIRKNIIAMIIVALAGFTFIVPAQADRADRGDRDQGYSRYDRSNDRDSNRREYLSREQRLETRQPSTFDRSRFAERETKAPRGYVLDQKYHHDRYYPPAGYLAPRLPERYTVLEHHRTRYFYDAGIWYRRSASGFLVVRPPIGVGIRVLPPYYTVLWVGSVPYYYANGIYYVWYPAEQAYIVSSPPPESATSDKPTAPERLYIYPKNGQSEKQQAKDEYECHTWALGKTGFDPTRAGGNVPEADYFTKRSDYNRASKACLEARGYSVK